MDNMVEYLTKIQIGGVCSFAHNDLDHRSIDENILTAALRMTTQLENRVDAC